MVVHGENQDNLHYSSDRDDEDAVDSEDELSETDVDPTDCCQYYDGVLWISQGDRNGAFGTIFYLFVLNQLLYAERYNLQPFIHLTDVSRHVYDPEVHGYLGATTYSMGPEMEVTWEEYIDPLVPGKIFRYPGRPVVKKETPESDVKILEVQGTGVWNSYYESVVPLTLGSSNRKSNFQVNITTPCLNKPWVHLQSDEQLVHGLHLNCPYCVRAWKYGGVPPSLRQQDSVSPSSYHDWWYPMRHKAAWMVSKYYHPKSHLLEAARKAIRSTIKDATNDNQLNHNHKETTKCLAMHIRHSDKANKRAKIALEAFLLYCQAYAEAGGKTIYLATDSSRVIDKIKEEWPPHVTSLIVWQHNVIRSPNETAVFDPAVLSFTNENGGGGGQQHHHRTNSEVLVDILAMSHCQWLVHGLSAVSEAAIYTNMKLHDSSVNLEFHRYYKRNPQKAGADSDAPLSVEAFQQRLQPG